MVSSWHLFLEIFFENKWNPIMRFTENLHECKTRTRKNISPVARIHLMVVRKEFVHWNDGSSFLTKPFRCAIYERLNVFIQNRGYVQQFINNSLWFFASLGKQTFLTAFEEPILVKVQALKLITFFYINYYFIIHYLVRLPSFNVTDKTKWGKNI